MGTGATLQLILAAVLFTVGVVSLFLLRRSNKRNVHVQQNSGIIITGDSARDVTNTVSLDAQPPPAHPTVSGWRKVADFLAWLAALSGTIIAALAYWAPRGGG